MGGGSAGGDQQKKGGNRRGSWAQEGLSFVRDMAWLACTFHCLKEYVAEPSLVRGPSMRPTIENGSWLLVNKVQVPIECGSSPYDVFCGAADSHPPKSECSTAACSRVLFCIMYCTSITAGLHADTQDTHAQNAYVGRN